VIERLVDVYTPATLEEWDLGELETQRG